MNFFKKIALLLALAILSLDSSYADGNIQNEDNDIVAAQEVEQDSSSNVENDNEEDCQDEEDFDLEAFLKELEEQTESEEE